MKNSEEIVEVLAKLLLSIFICFATYTLLSLWHDSFVEADLDDIDEVSISRCEAGNKSDCVDAREECSNADNYWFFDHPDDVCAPYRGK
jgi:hypothetical protein